MPADAKFTDPQFPPEMMNLAGQACDIWQDYLSKLAADPHAKAELAKWMDPAQHANAPYMQMMAPMMAAFAQKDGMGQTGPHANQPAPASTDAPAPATSAPAAQRPASAASTTDDGALRMAQLALRVAELERRIGELEPGIATRTRATKPA